MNVALGNVIERVTQLGGNMNKYEAKENRRNKNGVMAPELCLLLSLLY